MPTPTDQLKIFIFVYYLDQGPVPLKRKVRSGWRAEVVPDLPTGEFLVTKIYQSRQRAIDAAVKLLMDYGINGMASLYDPQTASWSSRGTEDEGEAY